MRLPGYLFNGAAQYIGRLHSEYAFVRRVCSSVSFVWTHVRDQNRNAIELRLELSHLRLEVRNPAPQPIQFVVRRSGMPHVPGDLLAYAFRKPVIHCSCKVPAFARSTLGVNRRTDCAEKPAQPQIALGPLIS
jgi:hypothetical protein